MSKPAPVLQPMPKRLREAAARVRELSAPVDDARRDLNQLVVEAIDEGMSQREVAACIGVAKARIHAILTKSDPDDDDQ